MTQRPVESAAVRVVACTPSLEYDLRWYDTTESLVPLWWLGTVERPAGELVATAVLAAGPAVSPLDLYAWLATSAPAPVASHLVASAAEWVTTGVQAA